MRPSMRSLRPQSLSRRSGSTPGRYWRRSASSRGAGRRSGSTREVRRVAIGGSLPAEGHPEDRGEARLERGPVVGAHDVLGLAEVAIPRMGDRGDAQAGGEGALEVDRRVVDEQVDAD